MRYCIAITRQEGREPCVVGPYRSQEAADLKASALNAVFSASTEYDGCAASVVVIDPGSTPLRELLEWIK